MIELTDIFIHPTAVVNTKDIGEGTYIGPFCNITERVIIGKNCKILGSSSIGNAGEFKVPPKDAGNPIVIGDNVEIREFVTINTPMGATTKIGNACFLMTKCHVGHDSILEDNVVLSCGTLVGGHSRIDSFCYLGLNSSTHQYAELGAYSMIGANSFFKGVSPEGIIWAGVPARPLKVNLHNIHLNVDKQKQSIIIYNAEKFIGV